MITTLELLTLKILLNNKYNFLSPYFFNIKLNENIGVLYFTQLLAYVWYTHVNTILFCESLPETTKAVNVIQMVIGEKLFR